MRARRYGSGNTYRGRRRGSAFLKGLVAVLAVLLVLGILAVLLLGRYMEYTDDGVRINLPWLSGERGDAPEEPSGSDLLLEDPSETPEEPDPAPERAQAPAGAVEVPVSAVLDGTAAELSGGSAVVVTVKDLEGHLAWESASPLAQAAKGSTGESLNGDGAFSAAVRELAGREDVYLVARMNAFCDLWMCVHDRSMALTTQAGKLWYDTKGMPWLSPASAPAREYLNGLCLELAELGFDEILLDCAGFPESGRLSTVAAGENYPASALGEAVTLWLEELRTLLADTGVRLSVQVGKKDLADCPSGRTAEALSLADRIWVEETDADSWLQTFPDAGNDGGEARLVRILTEAAPETPEGSWAVLL